MRTTTVRIRCRTLDALKQIAAANGQSVQDAIDDAVHDRRRRLYLEGLNADYAALRKDTTSAADLDDETTIWDAANADGLDDR